MGIFDQLKLLHSEELWDSLCYVGELLLILDERNMESMQPILRFQATVFYADALLHLDHHRKAELMYMKALSLRKSVTKTPETRRSVSDFDSEFEVKFRLHFSLMRQEKFQEAVGVLESIPETFRTPKMEAALGKLYRQMGKSPLASHRYMEFLKQCPFALDAAVELLECGVSRQAVDHVLSDKADKSLLDSLPWLPIWLNAHQALANKEYMLAAETFSELCDKSALCNNGMILACLGRAFYYAGEKHRAITALQRAHSLDPVSLEGMDLLAALLCEERQTKELEGLATALMTDNPNASESWTAFGYYCLAQKKFSKALYFAQRAASPNSESRLDVEGVILKGRILLLSGKREEAAQHFKEALNFEPCRVEIYDGLTKSLLKMDKYNEALGFADLCKKNLGESFPRALALHATVLAQNPTRNESEKEACYKKAVKSLEKAVEKAPHLLNAVYLLVELYGKQQQHEKAVSLLRKQTDLHVNSRLHRMLGEFLSKTNRPSDAVGSYHYALCLDPDDQASAEGLEAVDGMLASSAFATPEAPATTGFTRLVNAPPRRGFQVDSDSPMDDSFLSS